MGTTSTGENCHQLAGCGALSKKRARLALGDLVKENAHINTDKASAYDGLFEKLGATHSSWDSPGGQGRAFSYQLSPLRNKAFHARRFNGVASMNLSRYLSLIFWLDNSNEEDMLSSLESDHYTVKRSRMTGTYLPPMDDLSRQTVTRTL